MYQTQAQLNSQLVKQKQDFVSCNNTFGILLSTMESFLIISGYKLIKDNIDFLILIKFLL